MIEVKNIIDEKVKKLKKKIKQHFPLVNTKNPNDENVVYVIFSLSSINNKDTQYYYIGESINFEDRKSQHINDLLSNKHHNFYLQNLVNKYGIDDLVFIKLCSCESKSSNFDSCVEVENKVIINTYHENFNLTKEKYSESGFERKVLYQVDPLSLKIVAVFPSTQEASRKLKITRSGLSESANNEISLICFKGFFWVYEKDLNKEYLEKRKQAYINSPKTTKKVVAFNSETKEFLGIFNNTVEASTKYNFSPGSICRSCLRNSWYQNIGIRKNGYGLCFRYLYELEIINDIPIFKE